MLNFLATLSEFKPVQLNKYPKLRIDESDKITTLYANAGGEMYIDRITLRVTSLASDEILLCNVIDVPEDYLASVSEEVRF